MTVALLVEGPSDAEVFKQVIARLEFRDQLGRTPRVRAGRAHLQGEAILDRVDEIVRSYKEEKVVILVDSDKQSKVDGLKKSVHPGSAWV